MTAAVGASAVLLAAAGGWLLAGGPAAARDRLAARDRRGADGRQPRGRDGVAAGPVGTVVVGAVVVLLVWAVGGAPAVGAVAVVAGVRREVRRRRARRGAELRRREVGDLLAGVAGELRSGADVRTAVSAAAAGLPRLAGVAAATATPAGDLARALTTVGGEPGGRSAADLSAACRVAELTGCSLVGPVERLLAAHRADDRLRREVAAQLAGPTATAYLLALLPLAGVGLGSALGTDPVGFLLGRPAGLACLVAGGALCAVGLTWTRSITGSVTGDLDRPDPRAAT